MRLPQDLANLLAIAIRDVIWFQKNVRSFSVVYEEERNGEKVCAALLLHCGSRSVGLWGVDDCSSNSGGELAQSHQLVLHMLRGLPAMHY